MRISYQGEEIVKVAQRDLFGKYVARTVQQSVTTTRLLARSTWPALTLDSAITCTERDASGGRAGALSVGCPPTLRTTCVPGTAGLPRRRSSTRSPSTRRTRRSTSAAATARASAAAARSARARSARYATLSPEKRRPAYDGAAQTPRACGRAAPDAAMV